ncbi:ABC transporter permease [Oceanicella actignis]|uniref:Simple sugar transport system permease protein n=1 Tax=Oceanicella actignis TaxID=1189325 RepID=A0A1M7SGM3_9RHOB|nr:ABC transporter permease [Oceanicella actignis]SET20953.1 nucleoside ABC transporter membrane protein [Oceanicella actignis]SHN57611.1 simple sugar transport system permease protein [Oceanicella actignis]
MNAQLPRWVDLGLIPLLNLAAALLVAGLVVALIGQSPLEAVRLIVQGAFGYGEGVGFTLFYATNFIFTGLAVAVAFHAGLFNIGGEGQAYVGGLGVGLACLALDRWLPWWLIAPVAALAGAAFGAAWAFLPAWFQARRGSHIVITTIMFNFLAATLMVYLLVNVLKVEGAMAPESRTFEQAGRLPRLDWLMSALGYEQGGAPLNVSFLLALAACVFVWALIWRTRLGYEIRTFGANPTAALYAGIDPVRVTVITMLISGGLAGLMALNPVMGDQNRIFLDLAGGAGFVGIAVALMGRAHPLGVLLAAVLFGALYQGGAELAFEMPQITRDMVVVIQGLVVLFAGGLEFMFRPLVARLLAPFLRREEG